MIAGTSLYSYIACQLFMRAIQGRMMHMISYNYDYTGIRIQSKYDRNQFAEFEFLLQPIFNSVSQDLMAYEMLSKVISHSGEVLENEDFFNKIDDDFIKKIVLSQIHCINHRNNIPNIVISLNLTLTSLLDTDFVLAINSLSSTKLAIEIDNTSYFKYNDQIKVNIDTLRNAGHEIWLDDYYDQLSGSDKMLRLIVWDVIKIDKSFLYNNEFTRHDAASLILKLDPYTKRGIIFEGVETELQRQQLVFRNVSLQGYLLSYPLSWNSLDAQSIVKRGNVCYLNI